MKLMSGMEQNGQNHSALRTEYAIAVSIVVLAGLLGMAAWLSQGDTLLWSVIEAGLAWCL